MSTLDWDGLLEEICSLIRGWLRDETYVRFHEKDIEGLGKLILMEVKREIRRTLLGEEGEDR